MKRFVLALSIAAFAAGCGEDLEATTTIQNALQPAIPSCSGCQYKKALFGANKGRVMGTFTNISSSFTRTDVDFGSVSPPAAVPIPGEAQNYNQQVTASPNVTKATLRWWFLGSQNIEVFLPQDLPIK